MTKESVLKGISKSGIISLKIVGGFFVVVGILINVFLGLIIIAKLYGREFALSITNGIQILFNGLLFIALCILVIMFFAEILSWLVEYNKKFKEKKKEEFDNFIQGIIKKLGRNK